LGHWSYKTKMQHAKSIQNQKKHPVFCNHWQWYQYIPVTFKTTKNDENMCQSWHVTGMAKFCGFQAWPSPGPGPGAYGAQWSATTAVAGAFLQQTLTNDILYRLWTNFEWTMYRLCILVTYFYIYIVFKQIIQ
jgi:hypothetical protein